MKRYLAILALLPLLAMGGRQQGMGPGPGMPASAGGGSNSHVQSCGYQLTSASTETLSCSFTNNIGAGHLLTLCVSDYATSGATNNISNPTFTGDSGTFVNDQQNLMTGFAGQQVYVSCWHVLSAGGGAKTITLTTTTNMGYPSLTMDEFICPSCSLDVASSGNAINSSSYPLTLTSDTITTTQNGDVVVMYGTSCCGNGTIVPTAGSGYTLGGESGFGNLEYQIQSTAGSTTATMTNNIRPSVPAGSVSLSLAFK